MYPTITPSISDDLFPIDWISVPNATNPFYFMNEKRSIRKQLQIRNMISWLSKLPVLTNSHKKHPVVVDFCSGSGHLGLLIAYFFPWVQVVLVERNDSAVSTAIDRKNESNLKNVRVFHGSLETFSESFDVAVAIHACGSLTDIIQTKCFQNNASYVLCPCCVGKVQHHEDITRDMENMSLIYPRSLQFRDILKESDYFELASYGDYGEWDFESDMAIQRRSCKSLVEMDRNRAAEERGYTTILTEMNPRDCTPKFDIIVGMAPPFSPHSSF